MNEKQVNFRYAVGLLFLFCLIVSLSTAYAVEKDDMAFFNLNANSGKVIIPKLSMDIIAAKAKDWENTDFDTRLNVLQAVVDNECIELGLTETIPIEMSAYLDEDTLALFSDTFSKKSILIKKDLVSSSDVGLSVESVIHEVRHYYQNIFKDAYLSLKDDYRRLKDFKDKSLWVGELTNYTGNSENFNAYYYQEIEVDARDYAKKRVSAYLKED